LDPIGVCSKSGGHRSLKMTPTPYGMDRKTVVYHSTSDRLSLSSPHARRTEPVRVEGYRARRGDAGGERAGGRSPWHGEGVPSNGREERHRVRRQTLRRTRKGARYAAPRRIVATLLRAHHGGALWAVLLVVPARYYRLDGARTKLPPWRGQLLRMQHWRGRLRRTQHWRGRLLRMQQECWYRRGG
jgi:hypothetical protein